MSTHHTCVLSLVLLGPALAQAERTTVSVTPQGVFYQHAAAPGGGAPAGAPDVAGALRWTMPMGASVVDKVSSGNHGTMAWLAATLNSQRFALVSATEVSPPSVVHALPTPGAGFMRVKAADKAPFVVTSTSTNSISTVSFWSCYSTTPIWTKTVNADVLIDISETGQLVAIGTSPTTTSAQVEIFDALGVGPNTPIATLLATTQGLRQLDLSDDGSTLLVGTHNHNHVYDVATQQEVFQDGSTVSHDAHAISRDGSAFGRAGFNPIRAWVKNNGVYNNVLSYSDTSLGFAVYTAAGISADGTTFAAAGYDATNNALLRVRCWALTPTSSTLLWSYVSNGTGTLQTTPQAVSLSDDGRYIAVGTWGDQNNVSPEVMVFARSGTGVPVATIDTPGSCMDLDLSGDGQFLVVGTKAVHANVFGNGGEGYSYDLGGQPFWLRGTPSIGRSIDLQCDGAVADPVFLGFAGSFGPPLPIPGIGGELLLSPTNTFLVQFAGLVPASGTMTYALPLPNLLPLVGQQFALQAMRGAAPQFTNGLYLPITP